MGIDLYYHIGSPPARAVYILAKHLNLDINLKVTSHKAGETRTPEYLKLNPTHAVPTLVDEDFVLFESRAILGYLVNKYAPNHSVYPEEPHARATIDKVLYFDASAFFPSLKERFHQILGISKSTKEAEDDFKDKVAILEAILGEKQFLAGDVVTIADISVAGEVPYLKRIDPTASHLKLDAWYERVKTAVPALAEVHAEAFK